MEPSQQEILPQPTLAAPVEAFPWPPPEDDLIVWGAVRTWRESTLSPARFFRTMSRDRRLGAALLYYLPLGIVVAAIDLFWEFVLPPSPTGASVLGRLGIESAPADPLVEFLISPLFLLGSLFISAAVTHTALAILGGSHHGFRTTACVFCYSYGPALLAVVPRIGGFIAVIWMLYLAIIGLREAHETTGTRAILAVLLPVLIAIVLVFFAILLVLAGFLLEPVA